MTTNVQPGVEQLFDSPAEREGKSLIVSVADASSEEIISQIEATEATVEESLFYDSLAVSISPETDLEQLCGLDPVESVEIEGTWEALDEGNSHTQDLKVR
jgi:hypothetical protein